MWGDFRFLKYCQKPHKYLKGFFLICVFEEIMILLRIYSVHIMKEFGLKHFLEDIYNKRRFIVNVVWNILVHF